MKEAPPKNLNPSPQQHPPNPGASPPSDPPPPPPLPEPSDPYRAFGGRYPNPPEAEIPDPATLREQWRFAARQYSKWYSHAWGTAILAGAAFFALGWLIKGSNPLPSRISQNTPPPYAEEEAEDHNK